jgi:hypothetical protein
MLSLGAVLLPDREKNASFLERSLFSRLRISSDAMIDVNPPKFRLVGWAGWVTSYRAAHLNAVDNHYRFTISRMVPAAWYLQLGKPIW